MNEALCWITSVMKTEAYKWKDLSKTHNDKCVVLLQKAILRFPADLSVSSAYYSDSI